MTTSCLNNVESKRVSFGADDQVEMILYDNGTIADGPSRLFKRSSLNRRRSFTEVDSSPCRAKIYSQDAEVPRPISPPIQIATANSQVVTTPPVLPSITKRMEKESENPFRPNDDLYREVGPIIEAYKNEPFPPSPSRSPHNSPVPHQQRQIGVKNSTVFEGANSSVSSAAKTKYELSNNTSIDGSSPPRHWQSQIRQYHNGSERGSERSASLAEVRREIEQNRLAEQMNKSNLPPPNKPEIIHVEEKKRCSPCCTIQ